MRTEHVNHDQAHFRLHFVSAVEFAVSTLLGVFVGPCGAINTDNMNFRQSLLACSVPV